MKYLTPEELVEACDAALNAGRATVVFIEAKDSKGEKGCPKGKLLETDAKGWRTVEYPAERLREYLIGGGR